MTGFLASAAWSAFDGALPEGIGFVTKAAMGVTIVLLLVAAGIMLSVHAIIHEHNARGPE